jgi:hypothetical protein
MPSVTVLQLDTDFPRIAGDVGSRDTYVDDIEILRISGASVDQIVNENPASIAIAPFEAATLKARGDIIVTSCGFLSFWQDHLGSLTDQPFISSALTALPALRSRYAARDILTVTFDKNSLNENHFGEQRTDVIGLPEDMHLRQVISRNLATLDVERASKEITDFIASKRQPNHKHILLECTNLPPYKRVITAQTALPVTDILTCMEAARAGTIQPSFL